MLKVTVKLDTDFDAIMRLKDKTALYEEKYIKNVLPAQYFDDAKEECEDLRGKI